MMETIIYIAIGVAILLSAEALYFLIRYRGDSQRAQLKRRLNMLGEPNSPSLFKERRIARSKGLEKLLVRVPVVRQLELLLIQTDLNWTVASLLAYSILFAAVLSFACVFFLPHMPVLAVAAGSFGFALPGLFVVNERSKRNRKISTQLPDALDMMARSLKAGHGISSAFKLVAMEMPPPIAVEFGRCFEEHNVGLEFRDAVTKMTLRVPSNLDLKLFAVSLIIQHDTGGNLVEILEKIAITIRERFKFFGKLRALTAEVKASGFVLALLPFIFAIAITIINPKYLIPLIEEPLGNAIIAMAAVLWILGLFGIRTLSRIDY